MNKQFNLGRQSKLPNAWFWPDEEIPAHPCRCLYTWSVCTLLGLQVRRCSFCIGTSKCPQPSGDSFVRRAVFGHLLSKIIKVPLISESVHVFPPYGDSSVFGIFDFYSRREHNMLSKHWHRSQLVAHLVSVTLLIFTLTRVPCTLHQPEDRDRHVQQLFSRSDCMNNTNPLIVHLQLLLHSVLQVSPAFSPH